jgi:Transcription factor WhiB
LTPLGIPGPGWVLALMSQGALVSSIVVMRGMTDPSEHTPCHDSDPDLWFSEYPAELNVAKMLCARCPIKAACLAGALERREPWGVWGGEILQEGVVLAYKRGRGRPSKADRERQLFTRDAEGERIRSRRERQRDGLVTTPGTAGTCHSRSA